MNEKLASRYSQNPKGWSFMIAPAKRFGFFDAIVSSPREAWHLKIDSIFKPNPLAIGAPAEIEFGRRNSFTPFPYGFRRLDATVLPELLSDGAPGAGEPPIRPNLMSLLGRDTVVPVQGGMYAQGPFIFSGGRRLDFSKDQQVLDDRLTSALSRLMQKRYPGYV